MLSYFKKRSHGFTLIELLIVITIITSLFVIVPVAYQNAQKTARDAKRKTDLEQIRSALEIYRNDCGTYPSNAQLKFGDQLVGSALSCSGNMYIQKVPQDGSNPKYKYVYCFGCNPNVSYVICANMENPSNKSSCISGGTICGDNCGLNTSCNYSVCNP